MPSARQTPAQVAARHTPAQLAPVLFTDDDKAAARSLKALAKAAAKHTPDAAPVHSFGGQRIGSIVGSGSPILSHPLSTRRRACPRGL
jgi:hypothetical protein